MKRILSLTLALLMLTAVLSACGTPTPPVTDDTTLPADNSNADVTTDPSETELTDADLLGFAQEDNGDKVFTIFANSASSYEYNAEGLTGDIVTDSVYKRDRVVEKYLGIKFDVIYELGTVTGRKVFNQKVTQAIDAGDPFDLVSNVVYYSLMPSREGYYLEGRELEYCNFDNPWWMADMYENLSIADKLYAFMGDGALSFYKDLSVMYFNVDLWADERPDVDFYELVRNNEWTLDKFLELTAEMGRDLSGDGIIDDQNDQLAYVGESVPNGTFETALGLKTIERQNDGSITYLGLTERYDNAYSRMRDFHKRDDVFYYSSINDNTFKSMTTFANGNVAIMCNYLYATEHIRDMEDDYGIIPLPKYDSQQEKYYTQLGTTTSAFFVPNNVADVDLTSKVMEALAYYGQTMVVPSYYEVALKTKYINDPQIREMLDIVRETAMSNVWFIYNGLITGTTPYFRFSPDHTFQNLASVFRMREKPYVAALNKLIDTYEALD